jgi:GNAT superfamily N-acetyltransferase
MPDDPESLGRGLGPLLADLIPLLPSGARRAGAARVMAARTGDDTSFLVDHPIKTQLLALGAGGAGATLAREAGPVAAGVAGIAPIALVQLLRRAELKKIQRRYDSKKRKRLRELDTDALFDDGALGWGGSARLGAVNAYETMRKRKYQNLGSLAEANDALQLAASAAHPLLGTAIIPVNAHIDNREADRIMKAASVDWDHIREATGRVAGSAAGGGVMGALGTSGILGLAALATRKRLPSLSPILGSAAKDGLRIFDPREAVLMARAAPKGMALFAKEKGLLSQAENLINNKGPINWGKIGGPDDWLDTMEDMKTFQRAYNMTPFSLAQRLAGSISGLASAGAGATVGALAGVGEEAKTVIDRKPKLRKRANFHDQRNHPTIPLYLAAAALSSAGLRGAQHWTHQEGDNTPSLGTNKWSRTISDVSGAAPLLLSTEGRNNAFYFKPRSEASAARFLAETSGLPDHTGSVPGSSMLTTRQNKIRRLLEHGAIVADQDAGAPTIAHEAGHAKIEANPGILRLLQRHLYPHSHWIAPLAGAGSLAAGLGSGSALKGALMGTGIGALANVGMIAPEVGASYHALKHLKGKDGGKLSAEGYKDLGSALSTYLAYTVLPSTLAGGVGGWLSGRRKKEEDEEQEKQAVADYVISDSADPDEDDEVAEKQQRQRIDAHIDGENAGFVTYHPDSDDPDNSTWVQGLFVRPEDRGKGLAKRLMAEVEQRNTGKRIGLRARPFKDEAVSSDALVKIYEKLGYSVADKDNRMYKQANVDKVHQLWKVLRTARNIRRDLGRDAADRYTMQHLDSVYGSAQKRFFNNPQVAGLGLTSRSRPGTVDKALQQLQEPPKPVRHPNFVQETFDFLKEGSAIPRLPLLPAAC